MWKSVRLRFDRIMVTSLWPRFFGPPWTCKQQIFTEKCKILRLSVKCEMENICCAVQTNRDDDQCRWHGQVRSDCPGRICRAVWWRSEVSERPNIKPGSRSAWAVRGHQADPVSSPTAPNRALCHWQQTVDRPARVLSQLNEHWASTNERRRR